jgi:hypothetical protein
MDFDLTFLTEQELMQEEFLKGGAEQNVVAYGETGTKVSLRELRTYDLLLWELREGRMTIHFNASTSTLNLADCLCSGPAARYFPVKPINLSKTSSELAVTK